MVYDEQGNPTNYLGHTLTWEKGRQLKSFDDITYTYNANGIRTSKTVDGIKHTYVLDGTKILKETWDDEVLETLYDNEESVCGIVYNGDAYYFLKNLQGDIIAITDSNGKVVARYSYDAWGKLLSVSGDNISIASINPYRYRGYYFDSQTNLYYLQSRYYDANIGRFINADEAEFAFIGDNGTVESNLFAYCENSVTNNYDPYGYRKISTTWISIAIDVALSIFCPYVTGVYDIWGIALKSFYKRFGLTKVANRILTWLFPKVRGLFSKAWRFLDRVAKRVLKISKSIFEGWSIDKLLGSFSKLIRGKYKSLYYFVISLFSTGSLIAGFFDYMTDLKYDGYIRLGDW